MMENVELTKEAKKQIKELKFDEFGKLLDTSWEVKRKISKSISNSAVDSIYIKAKNQEQ